MWDDVTKGKVPWFDIEHGALGSFEEDVLATAMQREEPFRHVTGQRTDPVRSREGGVKAGSEVHPRRAIVTFKQEVVIVQERPQAPLEASLIEQVVHTQRPARRTILVGGSDAAPGGADSDAAAHPFTGAIESDVAGQDERAGLAHEEALGYRHRLPLEHLHLLHQRVRRQHHPVPDDGADPFAQDPGGDEVKDGFPAADHHSMTGIVAALETHYRPATLAQQVDDLPLAFVAPLGADDHHRAAHARRPVRLRDIESRLAKAMYALSQRVEEQAARNHARQPRETQGIVV